MWSSAVVAALHYLALAIGLPAVFSRGRALKGPLDDAGLRQLFAADTAWGLAALLWSPARLRRPGEGLVLLPGERPLPAEDGPLPGRRGAGGPADADLHPLAPGAGVRPADRPGSGRPPRSAEPSRAGPGRHHGLRRERHGARAR